MGAMFWHHDTPWTADPLEDLKDVQAAFFDEHYDLETLLSGKLENMRNAVRACDEDGDRYNLRGFYAEQVDQFERLLARPFPSTAEKRIRLLRKIEAAAGDEIG